MNNKGYNLTISIPSGNPDRLRLIQKTNRRLFGMVFNRDEWMSIAKERPQLGYTGVYLLLNSSDNTLPQIYIGEGVSVHERLLRHKNKKEKEFWEWAVVFVTLDNSLNKAHIQYLEAVLAKCARENKSCQLENTNKPTIPDLSEIDNLESEDLLDDINQMLPLLGITAFEQVSIKGNGSSPELLHLKSKGIVAEGVLRNGKLIVKKGSGAVQTSVASIPDKARSLRKRLFEQDVLVEDKNKWVFTQDYAFNTPSLAAGVVTGSSANGRTLWRNKSGLTLNQLEEKAVEKEG